jgi:hypothetical protein
VDELLHQTAGVLQVARSLTCSSIRASLSTRLPRLRSDSSALATSRIQNPFRTIAASNLPSKCGPLTTNEFAPSRYVRCTFGTLPAQLNINTGRCRNLTKCGMKIRPLAMIWSAFVRRAPSTTLKGFDSPRLLLGSGKDPQTFQLYSPAKWLNLFDCA